MAYLYLVRCHTRLFVELFVAFVFTITFDLGAQPQKPARGGTLEYAKSHALDASSTFNIPAKIWCEAGVELCCSPFPFAVQTRWYGFGGHCNTKHSATRLWIESGKGSIIAKVAFLSGTIHWPSEFR